MLMLYKFKKIFETEETFSIFVVYELWMSCEKK